ncbi:hypothetical protein ABIB85_008258 [Bradyrhizobium sp. JR1.5]|uniref:hypothetical protein n=1 Tax=unclassified Bradyrhizobium TaxID=2631580 RepID=UPI0033914046
MTMIEVILAELYRQSEANKGPGIYVDSSDHQRTMIDGWVDLIALVEAIDKHDTGACVPSLYRMMPYSQQAGGYVVFRHCFDVSRCSLGEGAGAHRVASFVTEQEATDYGHYRNGPIAAHGPCQRDSSQAPGSRRPSQTYGVQPPPNRGPAMMETGDGIEPT